jgi:hypothetical protein
MEYMERPSSLISRNGTYYVHVRVPADIVGTYGKRFETKSLRTKDHKQACRKINGELTQIYHKFENHRAHNTRKDLPITRPALSFAEIARHHARDVSDKEFADRAALFEAAHAEPSRLWKGELIALPDSRYFDHLVEDGDLDKIIGYIVRRRAQDRVAELRRMLATGNLPNSLPLQMNDPPAWIRPGG